MTTNALALPNHAWRRESLGGKVVAVAATLTGLMSLSGAFMGRYRLPTFSGWYDIAEALLWFGVGFAFWTGSPDRIRRAVAVFLFVTGLGALGFGLFGSNPGLSAERIGKLVVLCALGVGVWCAKDWARRACVALGLIAYGVQLATAAYVPKLFPEMSAEMPSWFLILMLGVAGISGPSLALAIYSSLQSTREHFAEVREARTRGQSLSG